MVTDRMWEDSIEMGLRNRRLIELATHHCTRMEFVQSGGRGMAEEATGLPINMRQVRCPVAHDNSMAMNLEFIIPRFYRERCVGCEMRRPTGVVPNLATLVEEQDAAAEQAAVEETERVAAMREEWLERGRVRQALAARFDDVMAGAIRDMALLDAEPDAEIGSEAADKALARLRALAERAPETFTADVVTHGVELVERGHASPLLLDAFRSVAASRPEFGRPVADAALGVLRCSHSVPAGRCVADLLEFVEPADVDDAVCRSMIVLAGAPKQDRFMGHRRVNDPVGLVAVAGLVPERLESVLRSMMPGPAPAPALVLPPGAARRHEESLFAIASAAGSVRVLAGSHPELAARLVEPMVLQLSSDVFERHDSDGLAELERALAVMLVLDVGDVPAVMLAAGAHGSSELGERLVRVLSQAEDLVSGDPHWREPGDPVPSAERSAAVADQLFELAMGRMAGDWGPRARAECGDVLEDLAKARPEVVLSRLPAILGTILELVGAGEPAFNPGLEVVGGEPAFLRSLQAQSDEIMRGSTVGKLLDAVTVLAEADPLAVLGALFDTLTDERDTERGADVAWSLLKTVGTIGSAHGDEPAVLAAVLPVLHTYLVGADVGARARALDAWVAVARRHPVPTSLVDLLPALTADPYLAVARSVMRATVALEWPAGALGRLGLHSLTLLNALKDGSNDGALQEAISAALKVARLIDDDVFYQHVEQTALEAAGTLDPYDLEKVLRWHTWSDAASQSPLMTSLRLAQAADPVINDRWNSRGDAPELVALLACGSGLLSLEVDALRAAVMSLGPDLPAAAVEFVEVAWRAGRLSDAGVLMDALLAATPDQQAYAFHKLFFDMFAGAVRMDSAGVAGDATWAGFADATEAAATALGEDRELGSIRGVINSVNAAVELRRLLMDSTPVDAGDPAADLRARADALAAAGERLAAASMKATATGIYLRSVASFCEASAHLLRAEAASFHADTAQVTANAGAATRRCELIAEEVESKLGARDPLGGPLLELVEAAHGHRAGAPVAPLLELWRALPLPVPAVAGPRRGSFSDPTIEAEAASAHEEDSPVAVVLASLDGHLVTGPAVLRDGRVYELSLKVQPGEWPEWASRLDAELLTHLPSREVTVPTFTWSCDDHTGDGETFVRSGSVALNYQVAAGSPAPPLRVRLTWRGQVDAAPVAQDLNVAGHRELRLRPYDETRDRATDYPVFDERLLALYDRLAREGFDQDQLQAFCRLFTSICRVGLAMTWEKKYRRGTRVTEREFHDDIHHRLMADPELGGRVERGSPLALGFLDVRHDGITAELKVERVTPATEDRLPKYMGQPTQYAAADGARLSILAVLDLSPKRVPVGTPENYLYELVPQLHGLDNPEAPSLVAALVVNGALPTPSTWSRRKTAVQQTPGAAGRRSIRD